MAERDAFGNEAGSGSSAPIPGPTPPGVPSWTPDGLPGDDAPKATAPPPAPAPTWTPPPAQPSGRSGLPPVQLTNVSAGRSVGGGRGRSPITTLVSLVVAAVIIGIPVLLAVKAGKKAENEINSTFNGAVNPPGSSTTTTSSSPAPNAPSTPPTGVATGSLVRPFALAKFVKNDLSGEGKLVHLQVAPDRINAQTHTSTGRIHIISLDYQGTKQVVKTPSGGFGTQDVIPLSKIDASAPQRMVKHIPHTKNLNYLILGHDFDGNLQWLAYYKNGHYYAANAHGQGVHRIS